MSAIVPTSTVLAPSDINTTINGEPRIQDLRLAEVLNFDRPRNIRKLIERHKNALESFGELIRSTVERNSRGRPEHCYYLTEKQALYLCTKSEAPNAIDITIEMVEVFHAVKTGTVPVKAHRRRKPVITHDNSVTVTFDPAAYVRKARESGVIVAYRKNLTRHNLCYEADDGPLYRFLKTAEHEAFNALRTALVTYLKDNQERLRAEEDVIRLRRQLADAERRARAAK